VKTTTALYPLFVRPPTLKPRDRVLDRQRVRYVDLLFRILEQHPTQDIMDRIERVLPWLKDAQPLPPEPPAAPPPRRRAWNSRDALGRRPRHCSVCHERGHDSRSHLASRD
jgi:hypothetical protein